MKDKIAKIAYSVFEPIMRASPPADHGLYRVLMTVNVDGQAKPLLLLGNASLPTEDGQCIAILNPNGNLESEFSTGSYYSPDEFVSLVSGRCDAALVIWFELYVAKEAQTNITAHYLARDRKPSKFEIK